MSHDAPPSGGPDTRRAVALAGHLGDAVTARAGLADPDARTRAAALGALQRCGTLTAEDLATALLDDHPTVRIRALTLAARSAFLTAGELSPLVRDPDHAVAEVAAWALGELPEGDDGAARTALLAEVAAAHPDALCREAAVAAIAAIGHPDGLAPVLAALADKPAVRRRAVVALAAFDDPRAEAALEAALSDRDRQVRETAEELLAVDVGGALDQVDDDEVDDDEVSDGRRGTSP